VLSVMEEDLGVLICWGAGCGRDMCGFFTSGARRCEFMMFCSWGSVAFLSRTDCDDVMVVRLR